MFLTGISAVLAKYPVIIIDRVTHPADGLPSVLRFPPTPAEVKDACERLMFPIRRQEEREARERERIQNIELEIDRSQRKTYGDIKEEFAKVGINISRGRAVEHEGRRRKR